MTAIAEAAAEILRFWLEQTSAEKRFAVDPELDAEIGRRFEGAMREVSTSRAAQWRDDPRTLLAAIILTDQFSRNVYRDTAKAFESDPLARDLTLHALDRGWDKGLSQAERQFLYMPMMHSEDPADQRLSVSLYETLGLDDVADFARRHHDQVERFGRFPGRNAALGRSDTPEEAEFLQQTGSHF